MGTGTAEKILLNYSGSTHLSFLCNLTSLSIDQINFITCQIFALCCSLCMKRWICNPQLKLIYTLLVGLGICLFCFGNQIFHIVISAGLGYLIISSNRSTSMPWLVLSACMFYLSCLHLQRQFFDELGSYTLDITGPLMVLTQKVTSLAFSLQDALDQKKNEDREDSSTEMQRRYAVFEYPTFLEYWSFMFQFQSMLAGPLILFKDFRDFIHTDEFPSPFREVVKKIGVSVFFGVVFIKVTPMYSIERLKESTFLWETTFLYRMFYTTISTMVERAKYYHAWIFADAVCNASGLGYNAKSQTWDLVTNVDPMGFEMGLNLKESLDCWNKGTMKWLRHVVYERVSPKIRTVATYSMSAIWHGFYPGYFITFLSGAMFTTTARQVRKHIRPLFLQSKVHKMVYDFCTWLTTRFLVGYVTFSFVILDFTPSILLYWRLFFCFHFASAGAGFAAPMVSKILKTNRKAGDVTSTPATPSVTKPSNNVAISKDTHLNQNFALAANKTSTYKVIEPVIVPPKHERDFNASVERRAADYHLNFEPRERPTTENNKNCVSNQNILSQPAFPEIKSYLTNNEHHNHKEWSSWTSQTISHGSAPVKLKTG